MLGILDPYLNFTVTNDTLVRIASDLKYLHDIGHIVNSYKDEVTQTTMFVTQGSYVLNRIRSVKYFK